MNTAKVEQKIVGFIRRVTKDAKGIVLGLSGGIDSAVTAALCVKALGSRRVTAVIMPERGLTRISDMNDAEMMAKRLDIRCEIKPINGILNALEQLYPAMRNDRKAYGNTKARARMIILYAYANLNKCMVAGTGNKSELSTGYFTKYGDGGVDFLPIGNLYKTEVKALAVHLNIPKRIVSKAPTAGLWAGQTDQGELGITYERLDLILGKRAKPTKEEQKLIRALIKNSEHKRTMPPVCMI